MGAKNIRKKRGTDEKIHLKGDTQGRGTGLRKCTHNHVPLRGNGGIIWVCGTPETGGDRGKFPEKPKPGEGKLSRMLDSEKKVKQGGIWRGKPNQEGEIWGEGGSLTLWKESGNSDLKF